MRILSRVASKTDLLKPHKYIHLGRLITLPPYVPLEPRYPHVSGQEKQALCLINYNLSPIFLTYRSTSLTRNRHAAGPCSRTMPRVIWLPYGFGLFLMGEVPLYNFSLTFLAYCLCSAHLTQCPSCGLDPPDTTYRGSSLIRKRTPPGPYRRPTPGVIGGS